MNYSFILMLISASALPLLSFLALLLRRDIIKGKLKTMLFVLGILLFMITIGDTLHEHKEVLTLQDGIVGGTTALLTLFILARYSHGHKHTLEDGGAKGIVLSEAFHSLLDGAVIGATYLVSPVLGYSATVGIIIHEFPKIAGTITLFRSLGLSTTKTIIYGTLAQIGSPIAALFIYILGKDFNEEQYHMFEIASISSLGAILLFIFYLEIRFHRNHIHPREVHRDVD